MCLVGEIVPSGVVFRQMGIDGNETGTEANTYVDVVVPLGNTGGGRTEIAGLNLCPADQPSLSSSFPSTLQQME